MDLRNRAFVLEIESEPLMGRGDAAIRYREYSRFPSMIRDVAFLVAIGCGCGRDALPREGCRGRIA